MKIRANRALAALLTTAAMLVAGCGDSSSSSEGDAARTEDDDVLVGLIVKDPTNPGFISMQEGARAAADEAGVELQDFAADSNLDNQTQVEAIESLIQSEADAILVAPADSSAIVPAVQKARDAGILVIALDTPTEPADAVDATFATDNLKAGELIGEYAAAQFSGRGDEARIALVDVIKGISVGDLRRDGFLQGFGIEGDSPQIVCTGLTEADQATGRTAMENCLQKEPDINLVYSINEPSGLGAYEAIRAAGVEDQVLSVSIDGSCPGVQSIVDGKIAATSMQFLSRMGQLGVEAAVEYARTGEKPQSGFTDTGTELITDDPVDGMPSEGTDWGMTNCFG